MLFDTSIVAEMREKLRFQGFARLLDRDGKSLFLVNSLLLKEDYVGIILAYESYGTTIVLLDRPLNAFRLTKDGFPMQIAGALAEFVNLITGVKVKPVAIPNLTAILLPTKAIAPKRKSRSGIKKQKDSTP